MASGIVFHNGHKKVELNLDVIEKAVNFTEEDEEMLAKKRKVTRVFLSNFIDDESIRPIVDYLIDEEEEKLNNIFDTSSSGLLKTAVVQCNFSDVSKVIGDVKEDLLVEVRGATVIKITELDELHLIIDRISESKGLCVLVIQQFEALNPSTLDHLTALIFSKSSLRKRISSLRLVVCICTSVIFLKSSCANETLNSLTLKQFTFTDPKQIFDQVMNINILPAVFSGNFLKYLRNRFFTCDYSVAALSRAVHYAFLSKYIDDPLWKQKSAENNERIEQYSKVIKIYAKMMKRTKLVIQFHYEIQTDKEFWDKATDEQYFRWIYNMGRTFGNKNLTDNDKRAIVVGRQNGLTMMTLAGMFGVTEAGISQFLKRQKAQDGSTNSQRTGRPRVTDRNDDRNILKTSRTNPRLTAPAIRREVFLNSPSPPSVSTVKRRLNAAGIMGRRPVKKPLISEKNRVARVKWAKEHLNWTRQDWNKILSSDEIKFLLFGSDGIQ
ncbi:unnamed protein product [Caenorhabditis auriculariae]|uniref:Transposase Tc1-like domain-containing protein n=1 Tax=Caenorhabditis auriculariae TaxID=2777116 RepID=A0A8S1GTT4_9PELO|nr:unnamed protein product [Caenorhabditis auriculariae]